MADDEDNYSVISKGITGIVKSPVRKSQASPARGSSRSPARPKSNKESSEVELKKGGSASSLSRKSSANKMNSINEDSSKTAFGRKIPDSSPVKKKSQNLDKEVVENRKSTEMETKDDDEGFDKSSTLPPKEETKSSVTELTDVTLEEEEEDHDQFEIFQMSFAELFKYICINTFTDIKNFFVNSINSFIAKDLADHPANRRSQICANVRKSSLKIIFHFVLHLFFFLLLFHLHFF